MTGSNPAALAVAAAATAAAGVALVTISRTAALSMPRAEQTDSTADDD